MPTTKKLAPKEGHIIIAPPRMEIVAVRIRGTAPLVQNAFSGRAQRQILEAQQEGSRAKSKKKREARNIEQEYKDAMHLGPNGEHGIPAPAFRSAMISACKVAGFVMTRAKLSVFAEADFLDAEDATPLVAFEGEPRMHKGHVRLESGVSSIAIRPMWEHWECVVRIKYDADQFSHSDVVNLLMRAGIQVGIGEGRPDSRKSNGMGWGTFEIVGTEKLILPEEAA